MLLAKPVRACEGRYQMSRRERKNGWWKKEEDSLKWRLHKKKRRRKETFSKIFTQQGSNLSFHFFSLPAPSSSCWIGLAAPFFLFLSFFFFLKLWGRFFNKSDASQISDGWRKEGGGGMAELTFWYSGGREERKGWPRSLLEQILKQPSTDAKLFLSACLPGGQKLDLSLSLSLLPTLLPLMGQSVQVPFAVFDQGNFGKLGEHFLLPKLRELGARKKLFFWGGGRWKGGKREENERLGRRRT